MKKSVSTSAVAAIAAGAAASVGSNSVLAADLSATAEPQWYLSLEGGAIFADPAVDKTGGFSGSGITNFNNDDYKTDLGYRGAAAFGQKFNENWDWRVGVAYSNFMKNHGSTSFDTSGGTGGSVDLESSTDLSYLTGDLELGYNLHPGDNFDLRLFAGLRALNSNASLDKFGGFSSGGPVLGSVKANLDQEFLGLGPRAGFDFSTRMGDGPFGISGMAAGSVLFGRLNQDLSGQVTSGGAIIFPINSHNDKSETMLNLEAALGIDFHVTDSSTVTLGYRGEYYDKIRGEDKSGSLGSAPFDVNNDLLAHGPFIRFIANF